MTCRYYHHVSSYAFKTLKVVENFLTHVTIIWHLVTITMSHSMLFKILKVVENFLTQVGTYGT